MASGRQMGASRVSMAACSVSAVRASADLERVHHREIRVCLEPSSKELRGVEGRDDGQLRAAHESVQQKAAARNQRHDEGGEKDAHD